MHQNQSNVHFYGMKGLLVGVILLVHTCGCSVFGERASKHPSNAGNIVLGYHPLNHDRHLVLWDSRMQQVWWWRLPSQEGCPEPRVNEAYLQDTFCAGEVIMKSMKRATEATGFTMDQIDTVVASLNNISLWPKEEIGKHKAMLQRDIHVTTSHHQCHASYAFFTSPFRKAIVVTMDLNGADLHHTAVWSASFGSGAPKLLSACGYCWFGVMFHTQHPEEIAMHSMSAAPDMEYVQLLRGFITSQQPPTDPAALRRAWTQAMATFAAWFGHNPADTPEKKSAISQVIVDLLVELLKPFSADVSAADGVVIGGGVARNSALPYLIGRALRKPVWRPLNPSDVTLAIGAVWNLVPPSSHVQPKFAPIFKPPRRPLYCANYTRKRLVYWLRRGNITLLRRDNQGIEETPAHHSVVSCKPLSLKRPYRRPEWQEVQGVIISTNDVGRYFEASVKLSSHSAAFRLRAREAVQKRYNVSTALVAAFDPHLDPLEFDLLSAASSACQFPLLFYGLAQAVPEGPAAYEDTICWPTKRLLLADAR